MIDNIDIESCNIDINIEDLVDSNDSAKLLDKTTEKKENNSRILVKYIASFIFSCIGIILCYDLIRYVNYRLKL
jgi:hypothetical protein